MRVGIVMDPIETIKPIKDSSFAMMLEAQRRGHELLYMEQPDLFLRDGEALARYRHISVTDSTHRWWEFGSEGLTKLAKLDCILMRKDPPVDDAYLYATYMLEQAEAQGTLIVNKPQSVRDANEKLFTAWFNQCTPATLVSSNEKQLRLFLEEHRDIILKPLNMMGGASIFRVRTGDPNTGVIIETMTQHATIPIMAQRYIAEITAGDKRILMIDGEPISHALARIPASGETRGNLAAGGRGEGVELSERDRWICQQVGPTLKEKGLIFVGLDVIGDYLTEINVTSPTCIRELDAIYGMNISAQLFEAIEQRVQQNDR